MTMTNEERRRASGAAMEAGGRGSGAAMEASRRASGAAMTARRTGKSVADDIQSLVQPPRQAKPLPRIDPVGSLPPQRGLGTSPGPGAGGAPGGGIASPLSEVPESRVYYTDAQSQSIYSNDYLLSMEVLPLKSLFMTDATGAAVQMNFALPVRAV